MAPEATTISARGCEEGDESPRSGLEEEVQQEPAPFEPPIKLWFEVGSNLHKALLMWSDAIRSSSLAEVWEKVKSTGEIEPPGIFTLQMSSAPEVLKARMQVGDLYDVENSSRLQRNRSSQDEVLCCT